MSRFTIRDVLFLMILLAAACGWYVDKAKSTLELDRLSKDNSRMKRDLAKATADTSLTTVR